MERSASVALNYPFDLSEILRKRHRIRENLLAVKVERTELRVALAGGSTTDELAWLLELFLIDRGFQPTVWQLAYNQYYQTALMGSPELSDFAPQMIVVHVGLSNLPALPGVNDTVESTQAKLEDSLQHFVACADGLHEKFGCAVILNNLPYPLHRTLGNIDSIHASGMCNFVLQFNRRLAEAAVQRTHLLIQDVHYLAAQVGLDAFFDPDRFYLYRIAESFSGSVHLAHNLGRMLAAQFGLAKKVIVVDLDNTLWGGVIGDDGSQGLQLGPETAGGEAFGQFQAYLKSLARRGVVLAVASKNLLENALQGFQHPSTVLGLDDFGDFQANWERKDENIVKISHNLSLGIDRFVFVDDNPAERQLVRSSHPQVAVVECNDATGMQRRLDREGYFEPTTMTEEDLQRTQMYASNRERNEALSRHQDYGAYLQSLEMVGRFQRCTPASLQRVCQLINKTNQFNTTALRASEAECNAMLTDPAYVCLQGSLKDCFGDHGLVSVVIGIKRAGELHLTHWLMSCRVLKRGLEDAMLEAVLGECARQGIDQVWGYYRRTEKNKMVENLYSDLGFSPAPFPKNALIEADAVFSREVSGVTPKRTHYIRSENDFHFDKNPGDSARLAQSSRT